MMLIDNIKNYLLLNILKNNLKNPVLNKELNIVKRVGLIVDESYFSETDQLIQNIIANGIKSENLSIIVYRNKFKAKELYCYPTYGLKYLGWNCQFTDANIVGFCKESFDLLINYYDAENAFLAKLTDSSKANFKVGFSSIDKRLNHFMISTAIQNQIIFVNELFRYLKILNKI